MKWYEHYGTMKSIISSKRIEYMFYQNRLYGPESCKEGQKIVAATNIPGINWGVVHIQRDIYMEIHPAMDAFLSET